MPGFLLGSTARLRGRLNYRSNMPETFYRRDPKALKVLKPYSSLMGAYVPVEINVPGMETSVVKYFKQRKNSINEESWQYANKKLEEMFFPERGIVDQEFAIKQIKDLHTSPGMPWRSVCKSKIDYFNSYGTKYIEAFWDALPDGIQFLWHITPKDELLPDYKVEQKKCRTIIGIPIEAHISFNRLCFKFNQKFFSHCEMSFVGKDHYYGNWEKLFKEMNIGEGVLELDGAAWDASVCARSLWDICNWRCKYLDDESDKVRLQQLYYNAINANFVLWDGSIVQKETGLPSGYTNTLVDNTLHNIKFALYSLHRKFGSETDSILKNFKGKFFGDDSIMAWQDLELDYMWFKDCGKEIGLDMTCALKKASPIWSCIFVGGRFHKRKDNLIGYSPSVPRVLSSLTYYRKPHSLTKYMSRLAGIRLNCYGNDETFDIVDNMTSQIIDAYAAILTRNRIFNEIRKFFLTREQLHSLHFGVPTREVRLIAESLIHELGGKYR